MTKERFEELLYEDLDLAESLENTAFDEGAIQISKEVRDILKTKGFDYTDDEVWENTELDDISVNYIDFANKDGENVITYSIELEVSSEDEVLSELYDELFNSVDTEVEITVSDDYFE